MPTIKGTASVSDDHAMAKQLKQTKFPKILSKKVKLDKVNVPVMSQWIEKQIAEILGFEDEIVASMAINLFLEPQDGMDPRRAQLNLVGFLGDEQSATFTESLWTLLVDAQEQSTGIPTVILEEKKAEMQKEKQEQETRNQQQQQQQQQQQHQQHSRENRRPPENPARDDGRRDYRRDPNHYRRDYDRRPPPPHPPPHGHRGPPPPRPVSPGRPSVDEFGRVVQPDEEDRKPRAYDGDRDRDSRSRRDRYEDNPRHDRRHHRDDYREEHHDRRYRDDRRRVERDYPRYDDRDGYRRRRRSEERRRRRSRSSSSSSRSRSLSRSRSRSSSRSRSPS